MNSVNLIGNLGKDWEMQTIPSGKQLAKTSIAIKKYDKSIFWVNLTAWGKTAEILCNHTQKGQQIGITGELDIREHEGKYYTSVTVNSFSFCGSKPEQSNNQHQQPNPNYSNHGPSASGQDDLPF